ncbi:MAG: bifunctional diguanylate cyclase/phosphodiesterase [Frankiales bacterium]|nr:bifunctional diguanylate cyclase/phosphodiesterase [Frankiales bacterium]
MTRTATDRPARLHTVVGTTVLAAVVVMALALWQVLQQPPVHPGQWLLLLFAVPLSERALLHLRFGGDQYSFTWGEACLLVGFVLVSPAGLVLLSGPLVMAVHLLARRSLLKALFNGASFTLSAGLAALVVTVATSTPYQVWEERDALALLAAVSVFSLISALLTGMVVAVSTHRSWVSVIADSMQLAVVVWAGNVTCAFGVLVLAAHSPTLLWAMPPAMLAVWAVYRAYLKASQDSDAWQQLEAAARELNKLEEVEVARAALSHARRMFRTENVVLVLPARGSRPDRVYSLDTEGVLLCSPDRGESRAPFVERSVGARASLASCVVAPLTGPTGRLGGLRLSFDAPVRLSSRERQLLSTFAHAVSTTLLNVLLYDDVCAEAALHAHEANHDPLTGLANRVLLNVRTTAALEAAKGTTALLLLDLDRFKEINDTLGHAAGDVLLQEVSQRLRRSVRAEDLVARLGGDEFAILLTGLTDPEAAEPIAAQVLALLAEPVVYEGLHLSVEASMGIACFPDDASNAEELFRRCDVAMYQAKAERGAWLRYDALRDDTSVNRLALVGELRAALDDQLVVYFQPQVDLTSRTVIGAEALVRWNHPFRGLLQPSEFVGVAEQSGLVRPFTLRILELAVEEAVTWQTPSRPLSVAVNVGARSLMDRQLPDDVAAVLARHGLPPQRLVLEITETTATSELEVVEEVLGKLRRLGVEISVDDFGTGYSSLAFLQRTSVHELKVDRSFVAGMLVNDNDLALVRATVQLAHALGARAVAEGVESPALLVALANMGCDVAQGFHLGRPMPAERLRAVLNGGALPGLPLPRTDGDRRLSVVTG